jgi:hypothetical protein
MKKAKIGQTICEHGNPEPFSCQLCYPKKSMQTKEKIGKNFIQTPRAIGKTFNGFSSVRSPLMKAMEREDNRILTENAAPTFRSSLNALVDLFAMGGAIRSRSDDEVIKLFIKAFAEDKLLALKLLFHLRNVRGGVGERKVFRTILKFLFQNYFTYIEKNIQNVPFFGRWDDLFAAVGTKYEQFVFYTCMNQLNQDVADYEANKPISLLAKWMPSENTSSAETRALATKIRNYFKWSPKQYRKTLSVLRAYIDVVERKMSANKWPKIDFEKVPSKASLNYRKTFFKHEAERYQAFIDDVKKGEKKINTSALFPYEIVEKVIEGADEQTMDILWDALPDYMGDYSRNIFVVADMSGSMAGRPMATALALAMYTAERNQGKFAGHFITFSEKPTLQRIVGNNIRERIMSIREHAHVNTNLQAVFEKLLDTAIENKVKQADMPEQILVVTDMEFDRPYGRTQTNVEGIKEQYLNAGYKMPQLVFWNVDSRQNNVPVEANKRGVLLVSGSSPSVFKTLLSGKQYTPVDQMLETLNQKMYDRVVI